MGGLMWEGEERIYKSHGLTLTHNEKRKEPHQVHLGRKKVQSSQLHLAHLYSLWWTSDKKCGEEKSGGGRGRWDEGGDEFGASLTSPPSPCAIHSFLLPSLPSNIPTPLPPLPRCVLHLPFTFLLPCPFPLPPLLVGSVFGFRVFKWVIHEPIFLGGCSPSLRVSLNRTRRGKRSESPS